MQTPSVKIKYELVKDKFTTEKEKIRNKNRIKSKIRTVENNIKILIENYLEEIVKEDEYKAKKSELDSSLISLNNELEEITNRKLDIPSNLPKELILAVNALLLYQGDPFKKEFLESFIDKIYLSKGKSSYEVLFDIHFKHLDEVTRRFINDKEK